MRQTALTLVVLVLCTVSALAHESVRIIGVVTKRQDTSVDVKTKTGKTFSVALKKTTAVSRDKRKVGAAELKVGQTVVVDAIGDGEDDLEAEEVRIVPAVSPPGGK